MLCVWLTNFHSWIPSHPMKVIEMNSWPDDLVGKGACHQA